ncbi:ABC transporter ATP-binding protein [Desulfonatronovibrio magnus]|uniref:ABC transporter ATP-binding protein n=1 Tax=Desulfonatronovibrio magnus TaxID=698827 RepID=UPI0005EBE5BA|nr:ABC transporter ATP-binding protein [Desulfonatronovibrio magnus]
MVGGEFYSFVKRLKGVNKNYLEYMSCIMWFFKDIWGAFPRTMTTLSVVAVLGASLQGAALVGLVKYIGFLENDVEIIAGQLSVTARSSEIVIMASLCFFLLLSLSAWMLYYSGKLSTALIGNYHAYMLKRAVLYFDGLSAGRMSNGSSFDIARKVTDDMVNDTQRSAFLTRFLTGTISSLVILCYSLPALFYIDTLLTFILLLSIVFFMPFFYYANTLAYKSDFMLKKSGKKAKLDLHSIIVDAGKYQYISHEHCKKIDDFFMKSSINTRIKALPTYFLSIVKTELLTNIMLALTITFVISFKVPGALSGNFAWTMLLAYLIFLRLGVNAFRSVMLFFIKFSRCYPHINRYRNFLLSSIKQPREVSNIAVKVSSDGVWEGENHVTVQQPSMISLLTNLKVSRYNFPYLENTASGLGSGITVTPGECFFVSSQLPQRGGSLRQMLNLPGSFNSHDLKKFMPTDVYTAVNHHIGSNLDKNAGEFRWKKLSLEHKVELSIISALLSTARVVIINHGALNMVNEERRGEVISQLKKYKDLLLIVYPVNMLNLSSLAEYGENKCAVAGLSGKILALGSPRWISNKSDVIHELLKKDTLEITKGQSSENAMEEDDV